MLSMEKIPVQKTLEQREAMPKGIAFVCSRGVERNEHDEIIGLDKNGKERLNKAIELYREEKIAYFIVCGGIFEKGLQSPVSMMMKTYLVEQGINKNIIFTERHSKDTNTNVLFGHHLIDLINKRKKDPISHFTDLPIYYISGAEHLERIRPIVEGQREKIRFSKGAPRRKPTLSPHFAFISSGQEEDDSILARIKNKLGERVNKDDPYGQSPVSKFIRKQRTHDPKK